MKKHIDIKSLLIGILLASTVLLAIGATSPTDKWDDGQGWEVRVAQWPDGDEILKREWAVAASGAEPFAVEGETVLFRKRIK